MSDPAPDAPGVSETKKESASARMNQGTEPSQTVTEITFLVQYSNRKQALVPGSLSPHKGPLYKACYTN